MTVSRSEYVKYGANPILSHLAECSYSGDKNDGYTTFRFSNNELTAKIYNAARNANMIASKK